MNVCMHLRYISNTTVWIFPAFVHLLAELQTSFVTAFLQRKARGSQTHVHPVTVSFLTFARQQPGGFSSDREEAFQQPLACCRLIKMKKNSRAAEECKQSLTTVTMRPTSSPVSFPPFVLMAPWQSRTVTTSAEAL